MTQEIGPRGVDKIPTGVPGFDSLAEGGLPWFRSTRVARTTGSARTILAVQFLAGGIREYIIDRTGMHIGERLADVAGVLSGHPSFRSGSTPARGTSQQ